MALLLQGGVALAAESPISHEALCRNGPSCRLTLLARLPHAPFPYEGEVGDGGEPFLDHRDPATGQRMHTVNEAVSYPEFPHYRDNRVLIHLPPAFHPGRPFDILIFFHGHHTELRRTLVGEMGLLRQVNATGRNLALVAPQMVLEAADSSPGKLYRAQGFADMLGDVTRVLRGELGEEFAHRFDQAPVILAAYSGGYRALAYTLDRGFAGERELDARLRGVILLDALYGETEKFAAWLRRPQRRGFFVNLHGPSSAPLSRNLEQELKKSGLTWLDTLKGKIKPGGNYTLTVATLHESIIQTGPPHWPLMAFLKKISK